MSLIMDTISYYFELFRIITHYYTLLGTITAKLGTLQALTIAEAGIGRMRHKCMAKADRKPL